MHGTLLNKHKNTLQAGLPKGSPPCKVFFFKVGSQNMETQKTIKKEIELFIDQDLVSFFDLLAKFDYEDKQKDKKTRLIENKNNSNKNRGLRATRQNNSSKTKRDI